MTQPSSAPSAALSDQQAILVLNITRYSGYMVLFTSIIMFIAWLFFRDVPQLAFYAVVVLPIAITSFLFPGPGQRLSGAQHLSHPGA
jgi:hypothetical protein